MAYSFRAGVDDKEYTDWLDTLPDYNITQTPMWSHIKTDWKHKLCLVYDDGRPVAGALLLIRTLFPGFKIIYSPRGVLVDYSDKELLSFFVDALVKYGKKIGAYVVRIDPEIVLSTYRSGTTVVEQSGKIRMNNLLSLGFRHMGFDKDFHTYTQPRYNAEIPLTENGAPLSDAEIAKSFDKKLRKFIGHYTADRGIFFEYDTGYSAVRKFTEISAHTEKRQKIILRNEDYFKRMYEAFGEDNVIFFAKIRIPVLMEFLNEMLASGDAEKIKMAEEDMREAERLRNVYGDEITLSSLLTVKGKKTAYLLYSGFDDSVFPRFRTTNQIRFEAMRFFRDKGCDVFSLLGIHGDLNDSLSDFKLKFNPNVVEYAGEFEYPISRFKYAIMKKVFPVIKKIYFKIKLSPVRKSDK